jgi:tRNA (guanine26-N2/guanine27-N2)-dimethyltransferase
MDANVFLSTMAAERQKVHYVDLDPSGSPVRFLEGSLRAILPDGLLGVSATDLAALSGASPRTALWRYGLRLTRTVFRKEVALRALTAAAVMAASRLSRSAVPVFAVIHRHFARVFLKVRRGKMGAYRSVSQLGYLKYCQSCLNVERVEELLGTSERCGRCGSQASLLGPLWLGPLQDQDIVSKVLGSDLIGEETFEEARKVLVNISQEPNDVPFSYPVSELSRRAKCSPVSPKAIVERLREMGYRASVAHYDHGAVKTDAPLDLLYELVRSTA